MVVGDGSEGLGQPAAELPDAAWLETLVLSSPTVGLPRRSRGHPSCERFPDFLANASPTSHFPARRWWAWPRIWRHSCAMRRHTFFMRLPAQSRPCRSRLAKGHPHSCLAKVHFGSGPTGHTVTGWASTPVCALGAEPGSAPNADPLQVPRIPFNVMVFFVLVLRYAASPPSPAPRVSPSRLVLRSLLDHPSAQLAGQSFGSGSGNGGCKTGGTAAAAAAVVGAAHQASRRGEPVISLSPSTPRPCPSLACVVDISGQ